ncbi:hypothetical protein [Amycolatopsis sp. NPDC051903]|uniref:hypothetical protein n=1 Tax=Amycolatopsis sp. NPDC051903 TaxID=3363936 RepID=UPI0037B7D73A
MSDTETFSHAARLGGLRPEVINRFVATQAVVNIVGPPNNKKALDSLVGDFTRWLRKSSDPADVELRRRVLLMVTEGRAGQGWADNEAASRILNVAEDVYNSIA